MSPHWNTEGTMEGQRLHATLDFLRDLGGTVAKCNFECGKIIPLTSPIGYELSANRGSVRTGNFTRRVPTCVHTFSTVHIRFVRPVGSAQTTLRCGRTHSFGAVRIATDAWFAQNR